MLRLTRTAIGLLTAQYRSVLKKCWAINVGVFSLMGKAAASVAGGVKDVVDSSVAALSQNDVIKSIPTVVVAATVMATTILPSDAYAGDTGGRYNTASGSNSTAFGYMNTASESWSSAFGGNNNASGEQSSAFGVSNAASGNYSSAFGHSNGAQGKYSTAFGYMNTASEQYSSAVGYNSSASGDSSSAFGYRNTASGNYSSAVGYQNYAYNKGSSAFGYQNYAYGQYSSAFGYESHSAKDYTTAIGYQAVANVDVTTNTSGDVTQGIISVGHKSGDPKGTAAGGGSYTSDLFSRIINVAAGVDDNDAVNYGQLKSYVAANAGSSYSAGTGISVSGTTISLNSTYMSDNYYNKGQVDSAVYSKYFKVNSTGRAASATGSDAIELGVSSTASGEGSSAFGAESNAAQNYTTAIGYQAVANVAGSTTQGIISVGHKSGDPHGYDSSNYTSDLFSRIINVAAGVDDNDAVNYGQLKSYVAANAGSSYSAGTGISLSGTTFSLNLTYMSDNYYTKGQIDSDYLHKYLKVNSTGTAASATGTDSIALGVGSTASGNYSTALGPFNTASGNYSSAFGRSNIASGFASSAFGRSNIASGTNSSAFGNYAQATGANTLALGAGAVANVADTISVGWRAGENSNKIEQEEYEALKSDLGWRFNRGLVTQEQYNAQLAEMNLQFSMNEDHFRRIINVAAGSDAHDALIVEQLGFTIGSTGVYTGDNKVYTSVADYVSNNYYRKEDLGGGQVIDFARYFKSGKFGKNARFLGVINDNFATNLTSKIGGFATNHPPRLGAFVKCEKACSRLSERYIAALGKNRAFEQYSRSARGTFLFVSQTRKNVMDSLSQNAQFMAVANDNFMIESKVA